MIVFDGRRQESWLAAALFSFENPSRFEVSQLEQIFACVQWQEHVGVFSLMLFEVELG